LEVGAGLRCIPQVTTAAHVLQFPDDQNGFAVAEKKANLTT
jgi:hypothetical protein